MMFAAFLPACLSIFFPLPSPGVASIRLLYTLTSGEKVLEGRAKEQKRRKGWRSSAGYTTLSPTGGKGPLPMGVDGGRGGADHLKRDLQMGGVSHIRASGLAMMAAFAGETTAVK